MLSCCLKYWKYTESKAPKVARAINGSKILLLKCAECDRKNQNLSNRKKLVDY